MNLKTRANDRIGLSAVAHGFSRGKSGLFISSEPASAGDREGQRVRSALSPAEAGSKEFGGSAFPRLKPWATALAPSGGSRTLIGTARAGRGAGLHTEPHTAQDSSLRSIGARAVNPLAMTAVRQAASAMLA